MERASGADRQKLQDPGPDRTISPPLTPSPYRGLPANVVYSH